jgi:SAM-dependent methyltransferase
MSDPLLFPRGKRRFVRFWNTYVRIPLPWANAFPEGYWASRKRGDSHGPQQYVELQRSSHVLVDEVVSFASGQAVPILDLGCNAGRHLNALYRRGFTNLYGVDVQEAAIKHMDDVFPEMAQKAHVEQASFQEYLPKIHDRFFDVVFTHGATIELVPPSFPICHQMARVCGKTVVLVISEFDHSFPRDWEKEFLREDFVRTKLLRPVHEGSGASLLVFQRKTA